MEYRIGLVGRNSGYHESTYQSVMAPISVMELSANRASLEQNVEMRTHSYI